MDSEYQDRWIACGPDEITVRGYYFPWGSKHIPYRRIRSFELAPVGTFTGRGRIWGTANPRYWASLDPKRPGKKTALILDLGGPVRPFLTPDDPDRVAAVITDRTNLTSTGSQRGPIV